MAYNASEGHLGRDGSGYDMDRGTRTRVACVPTGPDTAGEEHDTGEGFMLFTLLVFTRVFERANDRSHGDTGDGEAEPP